MSKYIYKSYNISVLIYHFICPAKYRKVIFKKELNETLKDICLEISKRYEISFLEIETDKTYVHFLIQSIPKYSVSEATHNNIIYQGQSGVIEPLSEEVLIYLVFGEYRIVTKMNTRNKVKAGDRMEAVIEMSKMHIFDPETEKNFDIGRA